MKLHDEEERDHERSLRFGNGRRLEFSISEFLVVTKVRRAIPWIWTGFVGLFGVLVAVTTYGWSSNSVDAVLNVVVVIPVTAMAAFASVLTVRQPGNRIAWVLHTVPLVLLLALWSNQVVNTGKPASPQFTDYLAVIVNNAVAPILLYAVFLLLYIFPTGSFLTPRWHWVWWLGITFYPALLFTSVFAKGVGPDYLAVPWYISNPIGFLPQEAPAMMSTLLAVMLMPVSVGGVVAIIVRYRRSDLVVRTQIKWVVLAAVVSAVSFPFGVSDLGWISSALMMVTILAIPTAITVAITKYRLFEIDRLISRTISYAIIVIVLGSLFAAGAVWLPTRLLGQQPPILVAASTLAVAALFNPLRNRVQRAVDRKFNRSNYQAERVAEQFAAQLQGSLTIQQLAETWVRTVDTHFEPAVSGIWLSPPGADDR